MQMNGKTKYLIIKGSGGGGIGDRIRSVLTGIIYAKLSKRTIFVDWSDGRLIPQRRNVFYDLFELKNIDHTDRCPVSDDVFPGTWKGKLRASLHDQYRTLSLQQWDRQVAIDQFSFDQTVLDYPHEVLVMWEFDQLERFSSHDAHGSALSQMQKVAAEHIGINPAIAAKVQEFRQRAFLPGEAIISVHIRATDEFRRQKNAVNLEQYISRIRRCMQMAATQGNQEKIKIFLATDNREIEDLLRGKFAGQLVTRNKWFALPGERIHFNRSCPDAQQSLHDAMVELCLLAESDYLIYQHNSSFGMTAHFFSKSMAGHVYPLEPESTMALRIKNRITNLLS